MSWNKNSVDKLKSNDGYFNERLSALTDWTLIHSANITFWVITDIFWWHIALTKEKNKFNNKKNQWGISNFTLGCHFTW